MKSLHPSRYCSGIFCQVRPTGWLCTVRVRRRVPQRSPARHLVEGSCHRRAPQVDFSVAFPALIGASCVFLRAAHTCSTAPWPQRSWAGAGNPRLEWMAAPDFFSTCRAAGLCGPRVAFPRRCVKCACGVAWRRQTALHGRSAGATQRAVSPERGEDFLHRVLWRARPLAASMHGCVRCVLHGVIAWRLSCCATLAGAM